MGGWNPKPKKGSGNTLGKAGGGQGPGGSDNWEELRHRAQGKVEGTVPSTGPGAQEGAHTTTTGPGVESDETCPLHIPT